MLLLPELWHEDPSSCPRANKLMEGYALRKPSILILSFDSDFQHLDLGEIELFFKGFEFMARHGQIRFATIQYHI